jgi:hypothetical protein
MKRRQAWLRLLPVGCLLILTAFHAVPSRVAAYPQSVEIGPSYTYGTAPLTVTFSTSAYDMQGYLTYYWGYGDGRSFVGYGRNSTGSAVTYTYTTPGSYQVNLTVCTDWGECDSAYAYVYVYEP